MKNLFFLAIILLPVSSCNKSTMHSYYGNWKLVKTDWTFLQNAGQIIPRSDSVITLNLNINSRYSYSINGTVQSSGTFSIKTADNTDEIDMTQSVPNANEVIPQKIFFRSDTLVLTPLPNPAGVTFFSYLKN